MKPVNLNEKLKLFAEHWQPKVVASLNDYQIKVVKIQGEFVWHQHEDTDELFLVISGQMQIRLPGNQIVNLSEGELFVVPRGTLHQPVAEQECHVLLIEPVGVVNTGCQESVLTAPTDVWI